MGVQKMTTARFSIHNCGLPKNWVGNCLLRPCLLMLNSEYESFDDEELTENDENSSVEEFKD